MKLRLSSKSMYSEIYKVKLTTHQHPSLSSIHYHSIDAEGKLFHKKYLKSIKDQLSWLISEIKKHPDIELHLLQHQKQSSHYIHLLPVIVALSEDNQFDHMHQIRSYYRGKLLAFKHEDIAPAISTTHNNQVVIRSELVSHTIFETIGFELSIIELNSLLDELFKGDIGLNLPDLSGYQSGSILIGEDVLNNPVYIQDNQNKHFVEGHILLQDIDYLQYLTSTGIILVNNPQVINQKMVQDNPVIKCDREILDESSDQSSFGINLLQLYTSYPEILIELFDAIHLLSNTPNFTNTAITVLDELYSTTPPDSFMGMSFTSMFVDDEYDSFSTMSNQSSKYRLMTQFGQYLRHQIFNKTRLEVLNTHEFLIIDISELDQLQQIMVDLMFRSLQKSNIIQVPVISDIFTPILENGKYDKLSIIHESMMCDHYIQLAHEPSFQILSMEYDMIVIDGEYLYNQELDDFNAKYLRINHVYSYIRDQLIVIFPDTATILKTCGMRQPSSQPLLNEFNLTYRGDEDSEEEMIEIDDFDDLEEFAEDDGYLPQYRIISISNEMTEYRRYTISEVEVSLFSEMPIDYYLDLMVNAEYLKKYQVEDETTYELDAKARTYLTGIQKIIREHEPQTLDEEIQPYNHLSTQLLEIMQLYGNQDFGTALKVLLQLEPIIQIVASNLKFTGLISHYYGLVASILYKKEHPDSDELFIENVRNINNILDEKIRDFDLYENIFDEMTIIDADDSESNISIEEVINRVNSTEVKKEQQDVANVIDQMATEIAEEEIEVEKEIFVPKHYAEIGIWHVSDNFIEIIDDEVTQVVESDLTGREIFVHLLLDYYNCHNYLQAEIYLKSYDLPSSLLTKLIARNIIKVENTTIILSTVDSYPKIMATKLDYEVVDQIKILNKISETSLKSQSSLSQIIKIFNSNEMRDAGLLVQAFFIEEDKYLKEQLLKRLNSLKSKLESEIERNEKPMKQEVPVSKPGKNKAKNLLTSLPKPTVKDNSTISTSYLKETPEIKGEKEEKSDKKEKDETSEFDLPDKIHSNLGRQFLEGLLSELASVKEESPEVILNKTVRLLFDHKIPSHGITDETAYGQIIEILNTLTTVSKSNFNFLTQSFSDIHEIYQLNPTESQAISIQYFKRINAGLLYFDWDNSISNDMIPNSKKSKQEEI